CQGVVGDQRRGGGIRDRLERRQLWVNSQRDRRFVVLLTRKLQAIGRVNLGLEFDGFLRRTFEAQRLGAVAAVAGALNLQRAREGVGVVLERNDATYGARNGIDQHQSALDELG